MTRTLKHDNKTDALLEKGMELLWSKGYNGTSVNDIVAAAKIPKGSFYFYFKSKEDFAIRSIEKYFDTHFAPVREVLEDKTVSAKQRLLNFHSYHHDMIKNEMKCKMGCLAANLGNEMSEHNEKIRKTILAKEKKILTLVSKVIKEAQDSGEIMNKMKASDIAAFIHDAGKGAMTTMKEMKSPYPIDNFLKMVKGVLLK